MLWRAVHVTSEDRKSPTAYEPASAPSLASHSGLSRNSEPLGAAELARLDVASAARKARWICGL